MKIGFTVLLAEIGGLGRAHTYKEIRDMAQRAEQAGFDSIWLYDHLLYRPAREGIPGAEDKTIGIWECWTILSALAEATQHIELGTLVLCNSFRNPAILAKMAHTLDEVSGGRYTLGIGAGWNRPEYEAFGISFDHRASRFEEALQIIVPLVKEGHVDFAGKYYQARDCEITPRGPRPFGPPILIGCEGKRMLQLAAQYADQWNIGYYGKPDTWEKSRISMMEACSDTGRDPSTLGMTVLLALAFPDLINQPHFEVYLSGEDEAIVEALNGYEKLGVQQVMFHIVPYNIDAFTRTARIIHKFKK